jgi:hypothetical protein
VSLSEKDDAKLKSWILLGAGLIGIGYQQWTGEVNWILLLILTSMTGVPVVTNLISLLKNTPTVLPSSLSQDAPSELESGNASPNSSESE